MTESTPPKSAYQKESNYTLTYGQLLIGFPSVVTEDEYEEMQAFFELCCRQAKRCIVTDDEVLKQYRT